MTSRNSPDDCRPDERIIAADDVPDEPAKSEGITARLPVSAWGDEMPSIEIIDPEAIVTVATALNITDAELARLQLEDAGIQAFINDAETVAMDWLLANAVGNIKVQVAGRDVEKARAILGRPRTPDDESAGLRCLRCGTPMAEEASACPTCGWSYQDPAESGA